MKLSTTSAALLLATLTGCSPTSTQDSGTNDVATVDTGVASDTGVSSSDAGSSADASAGAITLLSVSVVVHGTMQVRWENPTPPCDQVTIERSSNGAMFVTAMTVTGSATSIRDMPGHDNGTYCYRAVCLRGGAGSAPSNELCAMQ